MHIIYPNHTWSYLLPPPPPPACSQTNIFYNSSCSKKTQWSEQRIKARWTRVKQHNTRPPTTCTYSRVLGMPRSSKTIYSTRIRTAAAGMLPHINSRSLIGRMVKSNSRNSSLGTPSILPPSLTFLSSAERKTRGSPISNKCSKE